MRRRKIITTVVVVVVVIVIILKTMIMMMMVVIKMVVHKHSHHKRPQGNAIQRESLHIRSPTPMGLQWNQGMHADRQRDRRCEMPW